VSRGWGLQSPEADLGDKGPPQVQAHIVALSALSPPVPGLEME
jgi:hypothetical protein